MLINTWFGGGGVTYSNRWALRATATAILEPASTTACTV